MRPSTTAAKAPKHERGTRKERLDCAQSSDKQQATCAPPSLLCRTSCLSLSLYCHHCHCHRLSCAVCRVSAVVGVGSGMCVGRLPTHRSLSTPTHLNSTHLHPLLREKETLFISPTPVAPINSPLHTVTASTHLKPPTDSLSRPFIAIAMPFPVPPSVCAELDEVNRLFEQCFQAGDMTKLVESVYHDNAKALPPGTSN